jgi:hypothetical protein
MLLLEVHYAGAQCGPRPSWICGWRQGVPAGGPLHRIHHATAAPKRERECWSGLKGDNEIQAAVVAPAVATSAAAPAVAARQPAGARVIFSAQAGRARRSCKLLAKAEILNEK